MCNFISVNKKLFVIFLFVSGFTITNKVKAQVAVQDSLALVDLYNSTNGSGWTNHTNWLTAAPVKTWYGVTVINNRVDSLILYTNNLTGNLPSSIGDLTALRFLWLNGNKLNGSIPNSIGSLINLQLLGLNDNQFSGNIPATIGNLSNLNLLTLQFNQLSGTIPESIGALNSLSYCFLGYNQLSGTIPDTVGSLSNLQWLELYYNQLSGGCLLLLGIYLGYSI